MSGGWWFEEAAPGRSMEHPVQRTVGAAEHVWLAWATNNASDLHGNADRAAQGHFGQPVVLGALTAAIVVGLASPAEPPPSQLDRLVRGWRSIVLGRPVIAGDTLRAVSEVHATRPDADGGGGYVERTVRGFSQRNDVVVTIQETCYAPGRRPGEKRSGRQHLADKGLLTLHGAVANVARHAGRRGSRGSREEE